MKTRLFFGAPALPEGESLNFESWEGLQKYLELKDREKSHGELMTKFNLGQRLRCVCSAMGSDGSKVCYPPMHPHRHRIRLQGSPTGAFKTDQNLVACDNHKAYYLAMGWKIVAELCAFCCIREATTSENSCEYCLDKMTAPSSDSQRLKIKESGWCINRDTVQGCTHNCLANSLYCEFCTYHNLKTPEDLEAQVGRRSARGHVPAAKARYIPSSSRPCTLTKDCKGPMTAAIRLVGSNTKNAELWWTCELCKVSEKSIKCQAIPDPESLADLLNDAASSTLPYGPHPINSELQEHVAHIRGVIQESENEG